MRSLRLAELLRLIRIYIQSSQVLSLTTDNSLTIYVILALFFKATFDIFRDE